MEVIIVETDNDYENFKDVWVNEPTLIIPIFKDIFKHPSNQNSLSFLLVKTVTKIFILPYQHTDCSSFKGKIPPSEQPKFIWDKKSFLQTKINVDNLYDIGTYEFFNKKTKDIIDFDTFSLVRHYRRFGIEDNLGSIIPILKWVEFLYHSTRGVDITPPRERIWVDTEMIPILADVESQGIRVDLDKYNNTKYSSKHLNDDILYTKYNPYTMTSRPSNTYGGINFSALPKKGDIREMFIPREGNVFVQFDYDAYHVRIIGKMLNYTLPQTSAHQWLADLYGVSYDESKKITFRNIYGGIPDEYKDIEFLQEIDNYIHSLDNESEVRTIKNRVIKKSDIENPNSLKLFNYLLQAMETEFNMSVLLKLKERGLPLPILYVYDSFLFDIPRDKELIQKIKSTLESFGFPVKASGGLNYSQV